MTFAIVALIALMGFAVGQGRKDVVFTTFGYLLAAIAILIAIFFGCAYLYTNFVYNLWTSGMSF